MKRYKSKIVAFITIILLFMTMVSPVKASSTIYETESNNTYSTADMAYDSDNHYGVIGSSSDVDWWKFSTSTNAMTSFWLGNIPSGCDYDMYVYKSSGSNLVAASTRVNSTQEFIKARTYEDTTYYIKIVTNEGYASSNYTFRVKQYELNPVAVYTFDYDDYLLNNDTDESYDSSTTASNVVPYFDIMGYTAYNYRNQPVSIAHSWLPICDISLIHHHGAPGQMFFKTADGTSLQCLFANAYSGMSSANKAISNYTYGALSDTELIVFLGCETGVTHNTYGNLVDMAINRGAMCSLGWQDINRTTDASNWADEFCFSLLQSNSVLDAIEEANSWAYENAINYDAISKIYYGSSPIDSLVIY